MRDRVRRNNEAHKIKTKLIDNKKYNTNFTWNIYIYIDIEADIMTT